MKKLPSPFVIKVHNLIDILVAPAKNPLSNYEPTHRGEAALETSIRRWYLSGRQEISSIDIHLPSEQMKVEDLNVVREKFYRYLQGQLDDNKEDLFLFKKNLFYVFRNAILFLTFCMTLVVIIANESVFPNMPPLMRSVLKEGLTVIGWVSLWRPTELTLSEFGQLKKENLVYKKLLDAPINLIADDTF